MVPAGGREVPGAPSPTRGLRARLGLTFPLQLIPVPEELQRVRLVGGLDVVHVDVQVVRGVQEVVRQQGALALIQRNVDLGGNQRLSLTMGSVEVQRVGRGCRETGKEKRNKAETGGFSFSFLLSTPQPGGSRAPLRGRLAARIYLVEERERESHPVLHSFTHSGT